MSFFFTNTNKSHVPAYKETHDIYINIYINKSGKTKKQQFITILVSLTNEDKVTIYIYIYLIRRLFTSNVVFFMNRIARYPNAQI